MKALATDFTKGGTEFHQLKREGDVVLFERMSPQGSISYEVIRIRKYPTYTIADATIEAHEAFPPDESWGDEGWTLTTEEAAREKFNSVFASTPYTVVMGTSTGGQRGRKRSEFELEIPTGEFTVKQLHEKYPDKSVPFIHLRLNELKEKGRVKLVRTVKIEGARGKPTNVYEAIPLDDLPPELADAQIVTGVI